MNRLNILIVDDELSARELLKNLLEGESWVNISGEADSVDLALPLILKNKPDAILLDVQMPRKDGFVLLEKLLLHKVNVEVIFVTAYEKYAIKAIKASAFDYLLKPVRKSELIDSLKKLADKMQSDLMQERFSSLLLELSDRKKIKFRNRTGFVMVDPDDILFCQADSNYTLLELESGKSLVVSMNLGKVEELLPSQLFCRISRSAIVQSKYIAEVDRKNLTLYVENNSRYALNVSRKYMQKLDTCCDNLLNYK